MPSGSPSSPTTVRELGLPGRAVGALERAGVLTVHDLQLLTRAELRGIPGLGPGMVAAIRAVVPEPEAEEAPVSPEIPSFASLRSARRRSAVDVLLPGAAPGPGAPPEPEPELQPDPQPAPAAPRPAEYADLLRLGVRVARSAADASWRVARWSAGAPVRLLRRALHR